jgi:hypothetical protein
MIVISDGDLIKNQLDSDQRSGNLYTTMISCWIVSITFFDDDTGLINMERFAFGQRKKKFCKLWQDTSHNYLPLLILVLFGVLRT